MIVDLLQSVLHVDVSTVLIFSVIALVTWCYLQSRGLPPGPWGIPIFGYLLFLGNEPMEEKLHQMSKKYGNVMSMKMGPYLFVVLGNYEAIKEAYVKQGDNFTGRPDGLLLKIREDDLGVAVSEGDRWKEHRRFILSTFRDYGMGKLSLEPKITEEVNFFLDSLAEQKGEPYDFQTLMGMSTVNIICLMEFGCRFDYKNERFIRLRKMLDEVMSIFGAVPLRSFFPGIAKLPFLDKWTHEKRLIEIYESLYDFYREIINEHEANHVEDNKSDFIDAYLSERNAIIKSTGNEGYFDKNKELLGTLDTLFGAGTETVTTTLRWAIACLLCLDPEMQTKIQKEIDEVIGMERTPTMADRIRMIYTEAFLLEVQRYASVIPLNLFHVNIEDAEVLGHRIPKRSVIMTNLWAVHNDPTLWKQPDKFMPERFINDKGQIHKPEFLITFGIGKRACLGESLAKMELFLYFTSMLQRFTFLPPDGKTPTLHVESMFARRPKPYKVHAVQREGYHVT